MEDLAIEQDIEESPHGASTGHPKGLYLLFFTEMWERFSYYGMRAIFTLYMLNALLLSKEGASSIYGSYTGLVYLTPLIGGYVADKYWGNRRSILVGGILMALGQFLMFFSGSLLDQPDNAVRIMYGGLALLILGNGFFKPNISTMVGQLYPANDRRVDSAFSIFYMGINLGAFFAPLVCGAIGERYDPSGAAMPHFFKYGFLTAGLGMVVSTLSFELLKNKYLVAPDGHPIGMRPKPTLPTVDAAPATKISANLVGSWIGIGVVLFLLFKGLLGFDLVGSFIFAACIVAPGIVISDPGLQPVEKQRIWVIYILAFFVIFFWSAFEQAGASLTFFAQEQTNRNLFGWEMPASYFQSVNAVSIVIFAPIFAILWTKLGKMNREPASPKKQAIGLALLSLGYLMIAFVVKGIDPSSKVNMMWLILLYIIHTFGELCLSPIGLSMVNKLAPLRFASLLMGVWFLSTATANKFAGELSRLYPETVKMVRSADVNSFHIIKPGESPTAYTQKQDTVATGIPNGALITLETQNWEVQEKTLSFGERVMSNLGLRETEKPADPTVSAIKVLDATPAPLDSFRMKQMNFSKRSHQQVFYNSDKSHMYVVKVEKEEKSATGATVRKPTYKIEEWDLSPKKPSFLGFEISGLFEFFMIFVIMSGAAALILFLIVGRLLKMMHGIR